MLCTTGNIGKSDVADMMSCTMDAIDKNEFIDAERVAVVGGSHGGKKVNYVALYFVILYHFLMYDTMIWVIVCTVILILYIIFSSKVFPVSDYLSICCILIDILLQIAISWCTF